MTTEQEQIKELGQGKNEELSRLMIATGADDALTRILHFVNEGFESGRVNRSQLASWIILKSEENLNEMDLKRIRADHFDRVIYLESLLKKAKEGGQLPHEINLALQTNGDLLPARRGRKRRTLTADFINDEISVKEKKAESKRCKKDTGEARIIP